MESLCIYGLARSAVGDRPAPVLQLPARPFGRRSRLAFFGFRRRLDETSCVLPLERIVCVGSRCTASHRSDEGNALVAEVTAVAMLEAEAALSLEEGTAGPPRQQGNNAHVTYGDDPQKTVVYVDHSRRAGRLQR